MIGGVKTKSNSQFLLKRYDDDDTIVQWKN